MKTPSLGAGLFQSDGRADKRTDGQRDMTKPIVTFLNFAKSD